MVLRWLLENRFRLAAAALAVGPHLSGCASSAISVTTPPSFATGNDSQSRVYRLGVGDKLKVSVFGEENLSGQFEVNAVGQISMPLIGEIQAKGLALHELRASIATRLADGYLKNPKVTVEMTNYRPIFVHGEVKNGGEFPYKAGLSLRDAVAMAGGYTYRADESFLYIGRDGERDISVRTPSNMKVLPGDNIRIPERFF